jgi:hypothetical protein
MKRPSFVLLLTMLVAATGCHKNSSTTPDTTTDPNYSVREIFSGTLSPGDSQFYGFTVSQQVSTVLTLSSVVRSGTETPEPVALSLALGTLSADLATCSPSATPITVTSALTAHISQTLAAGSYCVLVADPGTLTDAVRFGVQINQGPGVEQIATAGTELFSSNLYSAGSINRSFGVASHGDITVKLLSTTPAASIGVGVGVTSDSSNCYVNSSFTNVAGSGGEVTVTADPGAYCVRVFDPSGLQDRTFFQIQIVHP